MQQIYPAIKSMTWKEAHNFGYCNPGQVMNCNGVNYRLGSGTSDDIHVFKSGATLYVLAINIRLDYMGFDAYMPSEEDPIDNIFLQGEWAIRECLGDRWKSLSAITMASRLMHHFN